MSASPLSITRPDQRFTLDGSDELEAHLERTCRRVVHAVRGLIPPTRLEAIFLGGGYGRGEGGVLREKGGERPYNDMEFYVFVRGPRHLNEWRHGRALEVLGEILTPGAGAHLEFKLAARAELARTPISMFSYDLVTSHRQLFGADNFLASCAHHCHAPKIPIAEATRLLMNRGTGLLLARERLEVGTFTAADADFVARNIAKCKLALGDAVLTASQRYHWSCRERHRRLRHDLALASGPADRDGLLRLHEEGVHFKLHPTRSDAGREELLARWEEVLPRALQVFLWIEEKRLGLTFAGARHYATDRHPKFPLRAAPRALAARIWQGGWSGLMSGEPWRAPRERLLRALALLLWEPEVFTQPRLLTRLQRELLTNAVALPAFVHAYRRLWARAA